MSIEQNKELVKRFVQDVKNRKDPAASQEIFSMEYEHHFHMPGEVIPPGYMGAGRVGEIFGEAFPEIKVTVDTLIAEGEYVLERSRVEALHGGQFYGTPATNKTITWTENHLYRIVDGKIVEHWPEADMVGVLEQIEALPAAK